jgi:hypothetical protein
LTTVPDWQTVPSATHVSPQANEPVAQQGADAAIHCPLQAF